MVETVEFNSLSPITKIIVYNKTYLSICFKDGRQLHKEIQTTYQLKHETEFYFIGGGRLKIDSLGANYYETHNPN